MMQYKKIVTLSVLATIGGIIWYGYFNEWIILRDPWETPGTTMPNQQLHKKEIQLSFWRHHTWHNEYCTTRLGESLQEQVLAILQTWFHEAVQLGFVPTSCALEAALYDARTSCLYLSCTSSPLDIQKSTYENLMVLESLLKTLRENIPHHIQLVQLLVKHIPLEHPHIICTKPMAVSGFAILHT
jgi:hypothetical protein